MIAIGVPVFGIALVTYLCGMIALLALIEGHLKGIKGQGELYRPNKIKEGSEPNLRAFYALMRFIASPDRSDEVWAAVGGSGFKKPSLTEKTR